MIIQFPEMTEGQMNALCRRLRDRSDYERRIAKAREKQARQEARQREQLAKHGKKLPWIRQKDTIPYFFWEQQIQQRGYEEAQEVFDHFSKHNPDFQHKT